jgi:hypothetical protein
VACDTSCVTCSDSNSCNSCNLTQFRLVSSLTPSLCVCLNGYYDSGQPICQPCSYFCLQCSSSSVCTLCDSASHRTLNASTQFCDCNVGFFDTQTNTVVPITASPVMLQTFELCPTKLQMCVIVRLIILTMVFTVYASAACTIVLRASAVQAV